MSNSTWYIITCKNAKESWMKVARFVIDNIPVEKIMLIAKLWGCTRWEYHESKAFIYNNMHPCNTLAIECDLIYDKYLNG